MAFGLGAYGLALLAGLLSTLSPCVLPILPVLLSSATCAHPRAPLALAVGLALSYAIIGTTLAWAGLALGIDGAILRNLGAAILGLLGLVLISASGQLHFAAATSGIGNAGNQFLARLKLDGLRGQFTVGLVLGVVWTPCVGPTLGAAVLLASQGAHLTQAALLMGVFGFGAALPVVALATLTRRIGIKLRAGLLLAGKTGKMILGATMLALAILILSGADRSMEAWLVDASPAWLTQLTTRF